MKKLPDAEFDVMKVVWASAPPVSAGVVMREHGDKEGWKVQTAVSLLLRLVERGFLSTEKIGKERVYFPLVEKGDYLKFETENFVRKFHDNSVVKFINTMYSDKPLDDKDIKELLETAKKRGD
ncbi:MAG: BlaI/MecI/CopY family transcriptional regulator [Defluviitaleaceae bacterium]|nr:BlaI/MecI/CopY family transcriptional regulator [Defluviitaleaceae bacterium]